MTPTTELEKADQRETATLTLPPALKTPEAPALLDALRARRGAALKIEAGGVAFLGGACLQALVAAAAAWRAAGDEFRIVDASPAFRADAATLGALAALNLEGETQP